jgi:hypothetical protein
MDIYIFKVRDYTTILVGQMVYDEFNEKVFYVQRGDGDKYKYDGYRVEWYKKVATIEEGEINNANDNTIYQINKCN